MALGDSFTSGFGDPDPQNPGQFRGWAGLVAGELSRHAVDFAYANLATPGLKVSEVVAEQVARAVDLAPDLATFQAGGNDLILPGANPDHLAQLVDPAIAALTAAGATVAVFVGPDSGPGTVLGRVRTKIAVYNENVRAIAADHGAIVVDLWSLAQLKDRRMWEPDRLHLSSLGHQIVAALVLDTLGITHSLHPSSSTAVPVPTWSQARIQDLEWTWHYFIPWLLRGITPRPGWWKSNGRPAVAAVPQNSQEGPRKAA